jgi:peptide/nickel transport system substrate-binding protein
VQRAACSAPSAQPVSQSAPTAAAKPAATSVPTAAAAPAAQPKSGGVLRSSQVGDPQSVDGHQFTPLTQDTMWLAYDRLLTYDDKLQPQPQLAESWEVSTDTKQIKLNLRKGAQFHNGRELTSDDVKYSVLRVRDPKVAAIAGQLAGQSAWWTTIDTPDKYSIVLRSETPRPGVFDFLQYLNVVDKDTMEGPDAKTKVNGTGPYVFGEWIQGDHVTQNKNKNYWASGKPLFDGVDIRIFKDPQAQVIALESGALDVADLPQLRDVARLKSDPRFQVVAPFNRGQFFYAAFNCTAAPTNNKLFRQGIAYAIDRKRFADSTLLGLVGAPQALPWPTQSPAYDPSKNNVYSYDLDKAKSLISSSGETNTDIEIIYWNGAFSNEYAGLAQILQADLAKVGVKATLRQYDPAPFLDAELKHNFSILLSASAYAHLAESSSLFSGGRSFNHDPAVSFTGLKDEKWDQLIAAASTEPDPSKRKSLYDQLNDTVLDLAAVVTISLYPQAALMQANVRNLVFNQMPQLTFTEGWLA